MKCEVIELPQTIDQIKWNGNTESSASRVGKLEGRFELSDVQSVQTAAGHTAMTNLVCFFKPPFHQVPSAELAMHAQKAGTKEKFEGTYLYIVASADVHQDLVHACECCRDEERARQWNQCRLP